MNEIEGRNYQILNTIATGGTAVLYKAIQTSLERPVVIKRLHSHLTSDPNFTKRFELEAKAAASLDHENIVRIIDFGSTQTNYYIVMEYIDGLSLKEVIDKRGVLDDELSLLIAHEICLGLDHAHQNGIIHRDIKPANIMITNEGQVKITDFGLAKLHQSQTQQTVANTLLGTPLYMSPEQAIGDSIDGRSDLFSLGTICYELLTGTQPFIGDNYAVVIQNILKGQVPAPSKLGRETGCETEAIVMKALNREPSKRFRTALEMARAIESLLGQEKIMSVRDRLRRLLSGEKPPRPTPAPIKTKRPKKSIVISVLATGLTAAALAVFMLAAPDKVDGIKMRISALLNPDPVSPQSGLLVASQENITGPVFPPVVTELIAETAVDTRQDTVAAVPAAPDSAVVVPAQNVVDVETAEEEPEPEPVKAPKSVPGFLALTVEPEADIYVDGSHRLFGSRLGQLELSPGEHEIVCRMDGYREYRETVSITKGELSRRRIRLQKVTGGLTFVTVMGAQVYIDGEFRGTTPLKTPILLPIGNHRVELRKVGHKDWANYVYIPADETINLNIQLVGQ